MRWSASDRSRPSALAARSAPFSQPRAMGFWYVWSKSPRVPSLAVVQSDRSA